MRDVEPWLEPLKTSHYVKAGLRSNTHPPFGTFNCVRITKMSPWTLENLNLNISTFTHFIDQEK